MRYSSSGRSFHLACTFLKIVEKKKDTASQRLFPPMVLRRPGTIRRNWHKMKWSFRRTIVSFSPRGDYGWTPGRSERSEAKSTGASFWFFFAKKNKGILSFALMQIAAQQDSATL